MTDERIKQLAVKCFWECEVKGGVATNFPRIVTPAIIEKAIRTALSETTPTEGVTIPLPLAQALADGADSLPVWELRGLLERVAPPSPQREKT